MVSLVRVSFSLATAPRSPALISGTFVCVLPCICDQVAEPLGRALRRVLHGRVGFQRALIDAKHRDAAGELIGDGLPHERGVRRLLVGVRARRRRPRRRVPGTAARPATARRRRWRRAAAARRCSTSPTCTPAETPSPRCVAFLRPGDQLVLRQRAGVEELLHQLFVGLGDHLDRAPRARRWPASVMSAGTAPSVILPEPSVANVYAFIATRSTTPLKSRSSPIGS